MCEACGVYYSTFCGRVKRGQYIEEVLQKRKIYTDYNGKILYSVGSMCRFHGVTVEYFETMIASGADLRQALNTNNRYIDLNGNKYNSVKEMYEKETKQLEKFNKMVENGAPLLKALTAFDDAKVKKSNFLTKAVDSLVDKVGIYIPSHEDVRVYKNTEKGYFSSDTYYEVHMPNGEILNMTIEEIRKKFRI